MTEPVDVIDSRLEWAWNHIEEVRAQVEGVMRLGGPYTAVPERLADGQSYVYRAHANVPIPRDLSFLVADCIHNLRATLDNVTFQLVRCYGPAGLVSFPVCSGRKDFDGFVLRHLQNLPPEAVARFERTQPYNGPNPRSHPIRLMNRLWIRDKHHASIVAGACHGGLSMWEIHSGNPDCVIYTGQPIHEGAIVAAALVPAGERADFEARISIAVGIDEPGPILSRLLESTLVNMHHVVRDMVVNELRPFFR